MPIRKCLSAKFKPGEEAGPAIAELLGQTAAFATDAMLAPRDRDRLAIIVEELASNATRHGMDARVLTLKVVLNANEEEIDLRIEDDGAPFDPTSGQTFHGPDSETGGGVGLELVRKWCESLVHSGEGGINHLDLRLRRSPP